jgi:hypothetical protein
MMSLLQLQYIFIWWVIEFISELLFGFIRRGGFACSPRSIISFLINLILEWGWCWKALNYGIFYEREYECSFLVGLTDCLVSSDTFLTDNQLLLYLIHKVLTKSSHIKFQYYDYLMQFNANFYWFPHQFFADVYFFC